MIVWDTANGKPKYVLLGDGNLHDSWGPDSKHLVATYDDNIVRIWDVTKGKVRHELKGHTDHVRHVSWSPDGKFIATSSNDNTVRIWDIKTGKSVHT